MRVRYSELSVNYETYTFGFAVQAKPSSLHDVPQVYAAGFLPKSDRPELGDFFYLARGVRVNLQDFRVRADERYVLRRISPLGIDLHVSPKAEVLGCAPNFEPLCLEFAEGKFENCAFGQERLRFITSRPYMTNIAVITRYGVMDPVGFALLCDHHPMLHVWFSFYKVGPDTQKNFGKFVLVRLLQQAQASGYQHCYLGTCYGSKSRYKCGFPGAEFYDGLGWNRDGSLLRKLHDNDDKGLCRRADILKEGLLPVEW